MAEWGGLEPAGLNSTAEPLTLAIHQCKGVTGQEPEYAECGARVCEYDVERD